VRREARTLATLRGTGDADRQDRALADALGALAVRQETFGTRQGDEAARHRRNPGADPAAQQVPDTVRSARPPDRVIDQVAAILHHRDTDLARTGQGENARRHGIGHPRPRRSWAVSNSGNPTTFE